MNLSGNARGALWVLASGVAATGMSLGIRALSPDIHSLQIAFARSVVGLALVAPAVLAPGSRGLATRRLPLHLARGVLGAVGINCGYYALSVMPLATATVLFFTAPLFVTALSVPLLGERVGWRRWTATALGFFGAVVVIGFDPAGVRPVMFVAVAASATFSVALTVGKRLSETEAPRTIMFYFGVVTSLACLPPAMSVWAAPSPSQWALLLGVVGLFAAGRTYCDIRGYAAGEASFVAPFLYARLLFMGVAGYLVFGEVPGANALAGAAVIVASTLYIVRRERRADGDARQVKERKGAK